MCLQPHMGVKRLDSSKCLILQHLPILHHVQVPQLHHLLLPLIDICELIQLLHTRG